MSLNQQRQRWQQVPPARRKGVVPIDARRKSNPQVTLEVINSRNALSGAGSDGLRFRTCSQ